MQNTISFSTKFGWISATEIDNNVTKVQFGKIRKKGILSKNLKKVKTLPYKHNYGYFFSSGPNTWHGMEKKEIIKERRCLQVNYVTFKTDWKVY